MESIFKRKKRSDKKRSMCYIGKNGQVDLVLGIVFFFVIIICIIFAYIIIYNIQDKLSPLLDNNTSSSSLTSAKTAVMMWNKVFYIVVVFFIIATVVTSYYIPSNPLLFFLSLFMLIISILIAAIFSNAYETFTTNPDLSGTMANASATFNIPGLAMSMLPLVALVFGIIVLVVLYMKAKVE